MASQTDRPVALLTLPIVRRSATLIRTELDRLHTEGARYAVVRRSRGSRT